MYSFFDILRESSKNVEKDVEMTDERIQPFYRLVLNYYEQNPEASEEEVYEYFSYLFQKINMEVVSLPMIKNATIEYNTCKFLNRNPKERKEAFDKIIREEERKGVKYKLEDNKGIYSTNKLSATRTMVMQALTELRDEQQKYPEENKIAIKAFFNMPKKLQSSHRRTLNKKQREDIDELRDLFAEDEFTQFSILLKKYEPILIREIREKYIESLVRLGEKYKELGVLSSDWYSHNKAFKLLDLEDYTYPFDKDEEGAICLENLFLRENLEKLDSNQLAMLNLFWLNRFTKQIKDMNQSFFIASRLGIFDDIKNAKEDEKKEKIIVQIDPEKIDRIYEKMNFLHVTNNKMFKMFSDGKQEEVIEEIEKNGKKVLIKRINAEPILKEFEKSMGTEYNSHFKDKKTGKPSDFEKDIEDYRIMENASLNAYKAKDMYILSILSNLYQDNFSKNWGIIRDDNGKNSKMILLGIDLSNLNMPVRIHVEKDVLIDFLKSNQQTTLIPVYEGEKDFNFRNSFLKTNILMPVYAKQRKAIEKQMEKPNCYYRNLVEHLNFLVNDVYPEHLKEDRVQKKKGKSKLVRKIPDKKYMDLITGEYFFKGRDGEFIEAKEKNVKEVKSHE